MEQLTGMDEVEGLPKGSFALFLNIHHACIDGATGKRKTKPRRIS
jgi:hypothetical protein